LKNTSKMKSLNMSLIFLLLLSLNISVAQQKKMLLIDAGHGGTDLGAIGTNHIKEKDITLAIAKAMLVFNKELLDNKYDMYLTRYADSLISLSHRTKLVKALQPDLFISVHCNHATNNRATGIEIYLHSKTSLQTENQKKSNDIALSMIDELTERLGYRSRGVKIANFQVLRESIQTSPAILVELGFLSNVDEAEYLELKKNTNALALAILMSIKM